MITAVPGSLPERVGASQIDETKGDDHDFHLIQRGDGCRDTGRGRVDRRRLFRVAAFGGIGAFVAWLVQPILVSVFSPLVPEGGPDFAYIESTPYNGVMEAAVFAGIGVGLLFMVTAVGRLIVPSSTAARVGHTWASSEPRSGSSSRAAHSACTPRWAGG